MGDFVAPKKEMWQRFNPSRSRVLQAKVSVNQTRRLDETTPESQTAFAFRVACLSSEVKLRSETVPRADNGLARERAAAKKR
jgi:hypothetical protein